MPISPESTTVHDLAMMMLNVSMQTIAIAYALISLKLIFELLTVFAIMLCRILQGESWRSNALIREPGQALMFITIFFLKFIINLSWV